MPNLSDYNPAVKYGSNLDVNVDLADIRDANNNEILELDTVDSAVNFISIANSITGTAVVFTAKGDDTNVDLRLNPKGTGVVLLEGFGTATVSQVAAGAGAEVTINHLRGAITVPDFDILSGSSFLINLTNDKLETSTPRFLITSIGRGGNTVNGVFATQNTIGAGSALIQVISGTTTAQAGSIIVNFVVL